MRKLTGKDIEESKKRHEDWLKLPLHKKLLSVVERYYEDEKHTTMDYLMQCPQCGSYQGMQLDNDWWECLWRDCNYKISTWDIEEIKEEILSKKIGISVKKIKLLKKYL